MYQVDKFVPCILKEPTDNLEDSLLYSQAEFVIGTEGQEENKSAPKQGENPGNHTETAENTGKWVMEWGASCQLGLCLTVRWCLLKRVLLDLASLCNGQLQSFSLSGL